MERFHPLDTTIRPPELFNNPFCYEPHPLAMLAAREVQCHVAADDVLRADAEQGKMLGVLIVERAGSLGFLAAYSGLLARRNDWDYFVPPVYDAQQPDGHFKQTEQAISALTHEMDRLKALSPADADRLSALRQRRRQMSEKLQLWLFGQYVFLNACGERKDLLHTWQDYHCSARIRQKYPLPPGGTGDCCAPKLLQYAYLHGLRPLCMAEFWYGASPRQEIRHHLQYYPACRGKCKPVLTWMLKGLDVQPDPETLGFPHLDVGVVYQDDTLLVVDKPSGLLSVPGRIEKYSVATLLQSRYPGAQLVHRLDMWTSGLLLAALTPEAHYHLQRQFAGHTVSKRYVALLDGLIGTRSGTIALPLLSDPLNRPRQTVDYERGKPAVTDYEVIGEEQGHARLALYPHTGRTHQLRMHCAHRDGLNCPIMGDELYGRRADRLYLHAQRLEFVHPATGLPVRFEVPTPF